VRHEVAWGLKTIRRGEFHIFQGAERNFDLSRCDTWLLMRQPQKFCDDFPHPGRAEGEREEHFLGLFIKVINKVGC
jgi:hypothetical protein